MNGRLDIARQKLVDELVQFSLVREDGGVGAVDEEWMEDQLKNKDMREDLMSGGGLVAEMQQTMMVVVEYWSWWQFDVIGGEQDLVNGGGRDAMKSSLLNLNEGQLTSDVKILEVKVVAVFDALMSGLPTHKETFAGVDIVFSGDTDADTWIETEVVALKDDGCPKVWVVTSDHAHQHAAYGAGAYVWSSKALVSEIKATKKEMERMLQEHRSTSMQGKLLKHNLDTEVVDALKDLKIKLSQNGPN
ncbi:Uncharacterized protein RDABS01_033660 [Bienertia sinuspersici]